MESRNPDIFIALPFVETRKVFTSQQYKNAKNTHKLWWNEHEKPLLGCTKDPEKACETHWNEVVQNEYDFLKFFIDTGKDEN